MAPRLRLHVVYARRFTNIEELEAISRVAFATENIKTYLLCDF